MAMIVRPSASLYVGGLTPDVSEADLYQTFSKVGGQGVASIRVCRDIVTRRSLLYAYVNFHNLQDAELALDTLNYSSINGKCICRLMWSQRDPALRKSGQGNIFIKNLEKSIDNKTLHDTFSDFGNILSCKVMVDENGNSRGFGFVHFENPESASLAINSVNGMLLNEKKVFVGYHVSRRERSSKSEELKKTFTNVFVKNLDENYNDEQLRELFGKYGVIRSAVIQKDENGVSKRFGYVDYTTHEEAEKACEELNEFELNGQKLFVGRFQKKNERKEELYRKHEQYHQSKASKFQGTNLFIKNLDDTIDDVRLRTEFSTFGNITSAKVAKEGNVSKGFGFVCFASQDEATKAVTEMNGKMLGTKPIYVALAQRKEDRRRHLEAQYAQRQQMRMAQQSGLLGPMGHYPPIFYGHMGMSPHPRGQQYVFPQMIPGARPRFNPVQPGGQPQQGEMIGGYIPNGGRAPRAPGAPNRRPPQSASGPRVSNGVPAGQIPLANQSRKPSNPGYRLTNTVRNPQQAIPQQAAAPQQAAPVAAPLEGSLTPALLAQLPESDQKQILGERLYAHISVTHLEAAGKITGMLLEMDNAELLHLIENPQDLDIKVNEALRVLQDSS